ncbi:hypothetical protein M404DRAFT_17846 [Pisolithus tinctorius Marx 270]|uniref:Uncharacterized protein n=1 Tax=Pisolithus tinctorius Marx 270 TaxID=870435 RepID=A0A0C3PZ07_PISTI|nr:hypothetical protein M404DRAFT_17846 [Pisolithus tinctorius Marx 270]
MSIHCNKLQVGSKDDKQAIQGKLAECKRHKAKAQEEAWFEDERQEQAQLKEERVHEEAEAQKVEAVHRAEEARKVAESQWADALVGGLTRAGSNMEVMNPQCLHCTQMNMTRLHNTDGKKKCLACNWCNELKDHCQWPVEGETGPGAGLAVDKGKRKVDVTSPHAGEKKKRSRQPSTKVLKSAGDKEGDVGKGPSMSKTSATKMTSENVGTSLITSVQMEQLIKAVECMADNMASLATVQREVSQNFYQFAQSYETYIEECFEFLAPDVPSDWDTTDEEDRDIGGLDKELEGLREEEGESQSWSESGDQTSAGSTGSQV